MENSISFLFHECLFRSKNARAVYIPHYSQNVALPFFHFYLKFGFKELDHVSDPSLDSQERRLASAAASAESV